jgi:hypothetical protein
MVMWSRVAASWVMTSWSLIGGYRSFGGICCSHIYGRNKEVKMQYLPPIRWYPPIALHGVTTQKITTYLSYQCWYVPGLYNVRTCRRNNCSILLKVFVTKQNNHSTPESLYSLFIWQLIVSLNWCLCLMDWLYSTMAYLTLQVEESKCWIVCVCVCVGGSFHKCGKQTTYLKYDLLLLLLIIIIIIIIGRTALYEA